MEKGVWVGIVIALALLIAGLFIYNNQSQGAVNKENSQDVVQEEPAQDLTPVSPKTYTIEMTSSGFSPNELTIKKGDTVVWVNKDTKDHWPASAMHPTHTVYPGSGIEKCGTAEEPKIFDACRPISAGEEYAFTFNVAGGWNYHDHLNTGSFGRIIVE